MQSGLNEKRPLNFRGRFDLLFMTYECLEFDYCKKPAYRESQVPGHNSKVLKFNLIRKTYTLLLKLLYTYYIIYSNDTKSLPISPCFKSLHTILEYLIVTGNFE